MGRSRFIGLAAITFLFQAGPVLAQSEEEVEGLKKEMRQVRSELQDLRMLLSELAEMDRQRAQLLTRALEGRSSSGKSRDKDRGEEKVVPPSLPEVNDNPKERDKPPPVAKRNNPPPPPSNSGGSGGGTISGKVNVPSGEPVAYVYVENVPGGGGAGETVTIEQVRKQFAPAWAVIPKGTTVTFPNLDNVYHNVFSRSPGNSFDLGLYSSAEAAKSHTFLNPGPVEIYCNIHPRMSSSILVVPNKLFAKVKPDGTFEIRNVPAGKRKVVAWAPGSSLGVQWVDLGAGGSAEAELSLDSKADGHKNKLGRPYGSYP
jgi:plastocyanin